ncbi:MAG: hypothetical protein NT090_00315 [Acidobacteria bacterium]|nr:hypothetical protein [Acidobacteriota bacterium]
MQDAAKCWSQRADQGLADEQLAAALRYEIGIYGGFGGPGMLCVSCQGASPGTWAIWHTQNTVTETPVFQGAATIVTAREMYGIRDPDDKQLALFSERDFRTPDLGVWIRGGVEIKLAPEWVR